MKIILDAVKSVNSIPTIYDFHRCNDSAISDYDGRKWFWYATKFVVLDYDKCEIRIVNQRSVQANNETRRYVLMIDRYTVLWRDSLDAVYEEYVKMKAAAERGEKEWRFTWN